MHQSEPESAVASRELGARAMGVEAVSHTGMSSIATVQWAVHSSVAGEVPALLEE